MEQQALMAVIKLIEVNWLVDLRELLDHRVLEECVALFKAHTERDGKVSSFRSSLQPVDRYT